ncbi:MAG: type II toxin-antitoxin system VapC family toxin [Bryobacterales bacterium]|nr:type II toxin-antitoxin system VapC family toxin [Bryobacterales bacterium]
MKGYVVDARILVRRFAQEHWSDEASRLLEAEATVIAPELLFAEVCNALRAAHRRGDIGPQDLADAIDALKAAPIAVPFSTRQLAASSTRLAVDLDHPVYDCFYLALAIQEQYRVVTADARFHSEGERPPLPSGPDHALGVPRSRLALKDRTRAK